MKRIDSLNYKELYSLLNKNVRFISDCEFFPNFDINGKIFKITFNKDEYIFSLRLKNKKEIKVGSNMKNLQFELTEQF